MSEAIHAYEMSGQLAPSASDQWQPAAPFAWLNSSPRLNSAVNQVPGRLDSVRCPTCHSIVYSRRHELCGVCAHPLPVQFLFSPVEAERIETLLTSERERHRQWLRRVCG